MLHNQLKLIDNKTVLLRALSTENISIIMCTSHKISHTLQSYHWAKRQQVYNSIYEISVVYICISPILMLIVLKMIPIKYQDQYGLLVSPVWSYETVLSPISRLETRNYSQYVCKKRTCNGRLRYTYATLRVWYHSYYTSTSANKYDIIRVNVL